MNESATRATQHEVGGPEVIDMEGQGLALDGRAIAAMAPYVPGRRPTSPDGYGIGLFTMDRPPPHRGERHPDGDELVIIIDGTPTFVHETDAGEEHIELRAGQAVRVPQGIWHRFDFDQRVTMVTITPGPNHEHRPLTTRRENDG